MKKIIILAITFSAEVLATSAWAQIENVATKDSNLVISNIYAGLLAWTGYKLDTFSLPSAATVRVGSVLTWKTSQKLSIEVMGVYEAGAGKPLVIAAGWMRYRPAKNWKVMAGYIPTPISEQRPFPLSPGGQFETWTMSQIPGGALGFKNTLILGKATLVSGIVRRSAGFEYQLAGSYGPLTTGLYYQPDSKSMGFATTLTTSKVYSLLVIKPTLIGNTSVLKVAKNLKIYNDCGFDLKEKKFLREVFGIFRPFTSKTFKGLLSFSYSVTDNSLISCLFIHI
ncbi:MAG TPA: hypothetical protein VGE63_01545 [Candidatus Paceibacterota bacterium]